MDGRNWIAPASSDVFRAEPDFHMNTSTSGVLQSRHLKGSLLIAYPIALLIKRYRLAASTVSQGRETGDGKKKPPPLNGHAERLEEQNRAT